MSWHAAFLCYFVFVDVGGLAIAMSHHDMPTIEGMEAFFFSVSAHLVGRCQAWRDRGEAMICVTERETREI